MEEKINAVVFKLIPCCLTLKPLVTSRLPTELMLSRTCSCCARDESTVSASVRDHTRERDLRQQHRPRSPSSSRDAGQGREAAGGMGSGWPGSGCSSAGHSLCRRPFPSTRERQHLPQLMFDCHSSQARLGTNRPGPGGAAVSSPHPPIPTHLSLPAPVTARAVPAMSLKAHG